MVDGWWLGIGDQGVALCVGPPTHLGIMPLVTTQAFSVIDSAAEAAHSHTESRIQFLTDTLFERLLREIPRDHSLRSRVTRTEMDFQVGTQPTIAGGLLAGEANKAVARDGLPDSMKTSELLLHNYRTGLRPYLPHLESRRRPTRLRTKCRRWNVSF